MDPTLLQLMAAKPEGAAPGPGVDALALKRITRRIGQAQQAPWLHAEVARRMAQRLPIIRLQPQQVLDWWSAEGGSVDLLRSAYPKAHLQRVGRDDLAQPGAQLPAVERAPWWSARRWRAAGAPLAAESAVQAHSAELLWSNMGLHHAPDPQASLVQWHRALKAEGFLMFSTLGPGTLVGLNSVFLQAGWGPAFAPFVDMHDWGDLLVQAGFADPVMDQETLTLTWPDAEAALAELRGLGGNAHPARWPSLRTRHWRQQLLAALGGLAGADGRVALSFELVYGHAFKPVPRARVAADTQIAIDDFKAMLHSRPASR